MASILRKPSKGGQSKTPNLSTRRDALQRGKRVGRPLSLTPEKLDLARRLLGEGKAIVARMIGVDPATLRRALNGAG